MVCGPKLSHFESEALGEPALSRVIEESWRCEDEESTLADGCEESWQCEDNPPVEKLLFLCFMFFPTLQVGVVRF